LPPQAWFLVFFENDGSGVVGRRQKKKGRRFRLNRRPRSEDQAFRRNIPD